ncbi:MAG TPA: hypothetical protein VEW69_04455, partial [Alphaproteobacteria bacterium]|nr:hypothetical protein [Alphaproteobacteria bacterium]
GKAGQAAGQGARSGQQGAGGTGGAQDFNLVPMAGVQLTAGFGVVKTDANGNFLLRDLPAGDLVVTLVPLKVLPADMKLPSGQVRMPAEPIQVEGATIVISNPELVPYLLDKTAAEVRDSALPAAQPGNTAKAGTGAPGRP